MERMWKWLWPISKYPRIYVERLIKTMINLNQYESLEYKAGVSMTSGDNFQMHSLHYALLTGLDSHLLQVIIYC
jgi:hypothetical protein